MTRDLDAEVERHMAVLRRGATQAEYDAARAAIAALRREIEHAERNQRFAKANRDDTDTDD